MNERLNQYKNLLKIEAEKLNYRVVFSSPPGSSKACHHPDYVVFIKVKDKLSIETIYSFAHEVGHCIDFKRGNLDFQKYRVNKKYRLWKEITAWWLGFKLCLKHKIPIKRFLKYSIYCLSSYFK